MQELHLTQRILHIRYLRLFRTLDITVSHPKELAWIVKSKKNDHVDSINLDLLPKSHFLSQEEQIFIDLIIQRVKIEQQTYKIKNSIIGYLIVERITF